MQDDMPAPKIKNIVHIGDFTLSVYAYRRLSDAELRLCAHKWLQQSKKRSFPKSGEASMVTIFGFDQ